MLLMRKNYKENSPMLCTAVLHTCLFQLPHHVAPTVKLPVVQTPGTKENLEPEKH